MASEQQRETAKPAPSTGSTEIMSLFTQALALHGADRLREAEQLYRKILQVQPKHFDSLHLVGVIHYQRGEYIEAVRQIDLALKIEPKAAPAHNNRGVALYALRRFGEALASYDQALALKPDYAEAFNNRGNALDELKRFGEALASYDQAIALKPDYAEAFNNRGKVLKQLERFDEALASCERSIVLKPHYSEAFNNYGNALIQLRRFDEAVINFDKAIALKPNDPECFSGRGIALNALKTFEEALASFEKAITLNSTHPEALYGRAVALMYLTRFHEALAGFDNAIAFKPTHLKAFHGRGVALYALSRFGEALASYDQALALKPDYAEAFSNHGTALIQLRRFDEAVASFAKAIALKPNDPEALNGRGVALIQLQRFDEALADFDKAIPLEPLDVVEREVRVIAPGAMTIRALPAKSIRTTAEEATLPMTAYILSTPDREDLRRQTVASLQSTDWNTEAKIEIDHPCERRQDQQQQMRTAALRLMQKAVNDGPDFILLLEDDLIFNRHLRNNLRYWQPLVCSPLHGHFFASLYNPGIRRLWSNPSAAFFIADPNAVFGSQAVLLSLATARYITEHWNEVVIGVQDIVMSRLAAKVTHIYYHTPSLVQHVGVKSTWGKQFHFANDFSADWKASE